SPPLPSPLVPPALEPSVAPAVLALTPPPAPAAVDALGSPVSPVDVAVLAVTGPLPVPVPSQAGRPTLASAASSASLGNRQIEAQSWGVRCGGWLTAHTNPELCRLGQRRAPRGAAHRIAVDFGRVTFR